MPASPWTWARAIDATPGGERGCLLLRLAAGIDAAARGHRLLLAPGLAVAGLVNYPTEWWHWSFGDRYWAFVTSHPTACYGPVPEG